MGFTLATKFLKDDTGANAVEYALLAGLLSVAVVFAVSALGGSVQASYQFLCSAVARVVGAGAC